jgi:glycine/D-amino acid oxidase-like deaminating enzyme
MSETQRVTILGGGVGGGQLQYGEVVGLRRADQRITGVLLRTGVTVPCETLVIAMGAWSGVGLSRWLGLRLPIGPHSLQKLHVRPIGPALGCAVRWGTINIVTRMDGLVHVGSKHDPTDFTARPTEAGRQWLLERLHTILPGMEVEVVDAAAGVAAATLDPERMPLLGPLPEFANVYLAVPSTNGFLHAAVLAHILTEFFVQGVRHPFMTRMLPEQVR